MWVVYIATILSCIGASMAVMTLATNDARDYQVAYCQALLLCGTGSLAALVFALKHKGNRRAWALAPLSLSLIGIGHVVARWSFVFQ